MQSHSPQSAKHRPWRLCGLLCVLAGANSCALEQQVHRGQSGSGGVGAVGAGDGEEGEGAGASSTSPSDNVGGTGGRTGFSFGPAPLDAGKMNPRFGGRGGSKVGESAGSKSMGEEGGSMVGGATPSKPGGWAPLATPDGSAEEGTGEAGPCTATQVIDVDLSVGQGSHSAGPKTKDGFCVRVKGTMQGWNCSNLDGRTITTYGETASKVAGTACNGANQKAPSAWTDGLRYFDVSAGSVDYPGMSFF